MNWTKALCPKSGQPQDYGIVSDSGCFQNGKYLVYGRPKYTLWHSTQMIGTWETADAAMPRSWKRKKSRGGINDQSTVAEQDTITKRQATLGSKGKGRQSRKKSGVRMHT